MSLSLLPFYLFFLPPQTLADLHKPNRHKPLSPHFSSLTSQPSFRFLSLFVFSSDRVPHYPTRLKSEHSVSLCTHPQATPLAAKSGGQYQLGLNSSVKIVKLCAPRCRSHRLVLNRIKYQAWVSVWLCWFFWVFVLFFFTVLMGTAWLWFFMGLTMVVAVCWWLNEISFYCSVYIILLC